MPKGIADEIEYNESITFIESGKVKVLTLKIIKYRGYDQFKCSAGSCPDTCCYGWRIDIDDESLEKYMNLTGDFGTRVLNAVDWSDGSFRQFDHHCALLDDHRLCEIFNVLGEDAMCETCRTYPRHVEEYENVREYSLSLSCPQAVLMLLNDQAPLTFEMTEDDTSEDDFEAFDAPLFKQLVKARAFLYNMLQNREISIEKRLNLALVLGKNIQNCIDSGEEFIEKIECFNLKYPDINSSTDMNDDLFEKMSKQFLIFDEMELQRGEWSDLCNAVWHLLFEKGPDNYHQICRDFKEYCDNICSGENHLDIVKEHLAVYFIYTYFCGAVYDDDVYAKMFIAVFSVQWISQFMMARWLLNDCCLDINDIAEIIWRYMRELEHSDENLNLLEAFSHDQTAGYF